MASLTGYTPEEQAAADKLDAELAVLSAQVDAAILAERLKEILPASLLPAEVKHAAAVVAKALPFARALALSSEAAAFLAPIFAVAEAIARVVEGD